MVLLKLMYLNICHGETRKGETVESMEPSGDGERPWEAPNQTRETRPMWRKVSERIEARGRRQFPGTLIQAKKTLTAFMLLYCVCQKARNSKSA